VVSPQFEWLISWQGEYIGRLPEVRAIFTDENGEWLKAGDTLRQTALVSTLRKVAEEGADYMYTGDWAKKFVETVQREGGKLSMQDLARYEVLWDEPVNTRYRGYDVYGVAPPNTGGVNTVEALKMLAQADLQGLGHYSKSAESLFLLLRAGRLPYILGTSFTNEPIDPELSNQYIPDISMDLSDRASEQHAQVLYRAIREKRWSEMIAADTAADKAAGSGHSDGIVVMDSEGNMTAIVHTCNTAAWGRSGIFVDGVSIPDAGGAGNQEQMARVGPGKRLYEATPPIAVLKDGKPFLISSCISMGVHEYTVQNLVNVLEYGMDPFEASQAPHFGVPLLQMGEAMEMAKDFLPPLGVELESPHVQVAAEGTFDQELLEKVRAMGEPLQEVSAPWFNMATGMWIGIKVDPETGLLKGTTVDPRSGGAHGK
jgi:gamma-glutamyltranspeptidase/glutathione hydrolase